MEVKRSYSGSKEKISLFLNSVVDLFIRLELLQFCILQIIFQYIYSVFQAQNMKHKIMKHKNRDQTHDIIYFTDDDSNSCNDFIDLHLE